GRRGFDEERVRVLPRGLLPVLEPLAADQRGHGLADLLDGVEREHTGGAHEGERLQELAARLVHGVTILWRGLRPGARIRGIGQYESVERGQEAVGVQDAVEALDGVGRRFSVTTFPSGEYRPIHVGLLADFLE